LRLVEKDKSELEIAGFLRNIFKYSITIIAMDRYRYIYNRFT